MDLECGDITAFLQLGFFKTIIVNLKIFMGLVSRILEANIILIF